MQKEKINREYQVKGMHCAACKNNVESALKKVNEVSSCNVNLMTNTCSLELNKEVDFKTLEKAVKNAGYELIENIDEDELYNIKKDYKPLIKIIIGIVLLVPLLFFGMGGMYSDIIPELFKNMNYGIYYNATLQLILSFAIIGLFFNYYINGFKSFIKRSLNMDSLVFLGSFFSLIYSIYIIISTIINKNYHYSHFHLYLDSASMILVIVSIGKYIEEMSKNKAKSTIKELLALRPKIAHLVRNEEIIDIPTKNIELKDVLLVKPGETIPSDGIVISGVSSVDESIISGESLPITKEEDSLVIGGSINKEAPLKILVNKKKEENVLSKIIKEVEGASNMKSPLTRIVDKVSKVFVPVVMAIALLTFIIWMILGIQNKGPIINSMMFNSWFDEAFTFGVGVLVISCPCALGLATPISLLVGSSVFSKNYIVVQNGEAIEKIKEIDTIVLDKTNTITEGELSVTNVEILSKDYKDLFSKIYSIEKYSEHPLGKAIIKYLDSEKTKLSNDFLMNEMIPGKGIKGVFKNKEYIYATNISYLNEILKEDEKLNKKVEEASLKGELPIFIYNDSEILAIFYLKDKLKKESKAFIKNAKKIFKKVILLTGDNKNIASFIAKEVGIDEVISEVKPTEKDKEIVNLQNEGHKVIMVGDGVNDSIALTRADIGIGIAKGSDIALASSDFILMRSNLEDIFKIINLSKNIRKNIYFNLFWAFIYNLICIPIAAGCFASFGVILSPMYCSMLMALSSVTVCLNSLTLFLKKVNK